jgi:Arc/MetJ-type ribon-helix-helix transcriptional regulator
MDITLPESLEPIVRKLAPEFESIDDYVHELIRADLKRREVDGLLIKSLDSGPPVVADEAFWEERRRRAHGT